jgi:hypothetical protein
MEDAKRTTPRAGGVGRNTHKGETMTTRTTSAPGPSPPPCLTREQATCLKTALGFVIAKRRLKNESRQQQKGSGGRQDGLSTDSDRGDPPPSYEFFPPLTQWTVASSNVGAITAASAADPSCELSVTRTWRDDLDHMMTVAHMSREDSSKSKQCRSVIQYIAGQLQSIAAAATKRDESGDRGQTDDGAPSNFDLRGWIGSHLVAVNTSTVAIWSGIACASTGLSPKLQRQGVPASLVPDLILSCLVSILKRLLDVDNGSALEGPGNQGFCALRLLSHSLPLASHEAVQDCWTRLGVDHSPVACNYADLYRASCRRRRLLLANSHPSDLVDSGIMDSSRILWLRRGLWEVFSGYLETSAAQRFSELENGTSRVRTCRETMNV